MYTARRATTALVIAGLAGRRSYPAFSQFPVNERSTMAFERKKEITSELSDAVCFIVKAFTGGRSVGFVSTRVSQGP
jgi:hypothetical protein